MKGIAALQNPFKLSVTSESRLITPGPDHLPPVEFMVCLHNAVRSNTSGWEILILQRRGMRTFCGKLTSNGLERLDKCEHWEQRHIQACRLNPYNDLNEQGRELCS